MLSKDDRDLENPISVVSMTERDLPEVVRVHFDAFSGSFNTRVGTGYMRSFFRWFIREGTAIVLVEKDRTDAIVGYVVGAPVGRGDSRNRGVLPHAALGILVRPWLLLDRRFLAMAKSRLGALLSRLGAAAPSAAANRTICLVGIGVSASARRRGTASRLVAAFERRAKAMGACSLCLKVYPENVAARRLYALLGWQCTEDLTESQAVNGVEYTKRLD